jgi:schlafen family protein
MSILGGDIESISLSDLRQIVADQIQEGPEVEYKSDLPVKSGRGLDSWHSGGGIGEYARNEIAEEIIAFANTLGGVVCIGVGETADHPKRASALNPIPRIHELARRLRQAVYDIIDPPLPILECAGIDVDGMGNGVVVLRVPVSRRKPHRHAVSKEVFYRRADESVRISMREIQELTVQALSEGTRADAKIASRRIGFRENVSKKLKAWHQSYEDTWGFSFQLLGIPISPADLVRVVGKPKLIDLTSIVVARTGAGDKEMRWPFLANAQWKPGLRSISTAKISETRRADYSLQTDGTCELSFFLKLTEDRFEVYESWLIGAFGTLLSWIERLKNEGGVGGEYILAVQFVVTGKPAALQGFEAHYDDGGLLPVGVFEFPLISIGTSDEATMLLSRFDEDIWNIAGQTGRRAPIFIMP